MPYLVFKKIQILLQIKQVAPDCLVSLGTCPQITYTINLNSYSVVMICILAVTLVSCLQDLHYAYASEEVLQINGSSHRTCDGGRVSNIPTLLNFCLERRKPMIYAPESRSAKVLIQACIQCCRCVSGTQNFVHLNKSNFCSKTE